MSVRYRPYAQVWAAVVAADFTLDQVRRRGLSIAGQLVERGLSCLVAYDTRFMGSLFARDLATLLQMNGVRTALATGPAPLPAVYHALDQRVADAALCISAGNRAYYYNGLMLLADKADLSLDPVDSAPPPVTFPPVGDPPAEGMVDVRGLYLKALRDAVEVDLIRRTSMTLFVDAMNGAGAGILPALLGESGQTRAIEINREPDPLFARVPPTPVESSLNRLKSWCARVTRTWVWPSPLMARRWPWLTGTVSNSIRPKWGCCSPPTWPASIASVERLSFPRQPPGRHSPDRLI